MPRYAIIIALALASFAAQARDRDCRTSYYTGDKAGAGMARTAREECVLNKARAIVGQAQSDAAQKRYADHFAAEGARRERATDRAIYMNEQWQNRVAQGEVRDAIRDQTRLIDSIESSRRWSWGSRRQGWR